MECYHPMVAYRSLEGRNKKTGKWPIVFNQKLGYIDMEVTVPCGKCIGCRLERSRQWAIRCMHESSLHDDNCFITLTYDNDHLDKNGSLNIRDYQLFMKRLRKKYGEKIRFFHCGEYGSNFGRPHHHACIFNFTFDDKYYWSSSNGFPLYRSESLEKLWPYGMSSIGNVTFESAAYVARYITKKITGEKAEEYYSGKMPEYVTMSRKPGIAHDWITKYYTDVYPDDKCIVRNGLTIRPAKYYDNMYDIIDHSSMERIKCKRKSAAIENAENSTPERLQVREIIKKKQMLKLLRSFENGNNEDV